MWLGLLAVLAAVAAAAVAMPCEEAHLHCAKRRGCMSALNLYMMYCSPDALRPGCPEDCQLALVAITSTPEGHHFMTCECSDESCAETKRRVELCRPYVERLARNSSRVPCRVAQAVCDADALCSTALDFYHMHCRAMFSGRRCSHRCNNSISILRRQEKAAKLADCRCDGSEGYDCERVQLNMDRLCFPGSERSRQLELETLPASTPAPGSAPASSAPLLASALALFSWWILAT